MEKRSYTIFKHVTGEDYAEFTAVEDIEMRVSSEANIHETMQAFKSFLLAVGFQPGSISQYIEDE